MAEIGELARELTNHSTLFSRPTPSFGHGSSVDPNLEEETLPQFAILLL